MAISAQLVKELREITSAGMMDCKKALEATDGDIDKAIVWLRENGLAKAAKKADRVAAEGVSLAKTNSKKAVIIEVNSETDFVSKNEKFVKLINDFADALLESEAKTIDEALSVKISSGETIEAACVSATATIGEKISFRRFELLEISNYVTTIYNHSNSRVSTLLQFSGSISKDDAYNVAMHVAAMNPKYISMDDIPQEFKDEEEHIIKEQIAKDEKFAGKPEAMIKGIISGKLSKRLSEVALIEQDYVIDENFKVGKFIDSKNSKIVNMIRYEVGEGIEKQVVDFASEVAAQLKGAQ